MKDGGCLLTVTFYGSEKVVEEYNLMGPVKAALESSVRYMAAELGPKHIRVHALSPGPLRTRAASGIDRFDELLERTACARRSISSYRSRISAALPHSSLATEQRLSPAMSNISMAAITFSDSAKETSWTRLQIELSTN